MNDPITYVRLAFLRSFCCIFMRNYWFLTSIIRITWHFTWIKVIFSPNHIWLMDSMDVALVETTTILWTIRMALCSTNSWTWCKARWYISTQWWDGIIKPRSRHTCSWCLLVCGLCLPTRHREYCRGRSTIGVWYAVCLCIRLCIWLRVQRSYVD